MLRVTGGWHSENDIFSPEFSGTPPVNAALAPIPANRDLVYPYLQFEWLTDSFQTTRNREQIARTEDLQFGPTVFLQLGYAAPAFGADRHALVANGHFGRTWQLTGQQQLSTGAGFSGRLQDGRSADLRSGMEIAWYWRTSHRTLTHVHVNGDTGQALDLDHYFQLGGDNGLRGYPLRYQEGSGRARSASRSGCSPTGRSGGCLTWAAPCSSMPDAPLAAAPSALRNWAGCATSVWGCGSATIAPRSAASSISTWPHRSTVKT